MGFALATGILYARFSRPRSFLMYSRNVLISPYKTLKGLMFRITNPKQNELIEAEAQVILSMIDWESGKRVFIPLDLELRKISFLALTWTIVHPIHSESPLFGFSLEDYEKNDVEIMVFIKSINDTYEQTVHSRHSYTYKDLIMDAKFEPILPRINRHGKMELNVDEINDFQKVEK
jgi:inward rectifier potassium channel